MKTNCPHCQAHLSPVTLSASHSTACPFCEKDVSGILTQWEAAQRAEGGVLDAGFEALGKRIEPLPRNSRIQIVEATPERFVLCIPPGWRVHASDARWQFCGTLIGVLFVVMYCLMVVFDRQGLWVVKVLLLAPATLYGLAAYYGITKGVPSLYQNTTVSLDAQRLTLENRFRFRPQLFEIPITTATSCSLLPLGRARSRISSYAVLFETDSRKIVIDSILKRAEKEWLVRQFNALLPGGEKLIPQNPQAITVVPSGARNSAAESTASTTAANTGTRQAALFLQRTSESVGLDWRSLTSQELPRGTSIEVQRDTAEILEFAFPLQFGWEWLPFSLLFALGVILTTVWDPFVTLTGWLVLAPFLIRFLYLMLGTVIVRVTPDTVECCWKSCGTVLTDRLAVADITQVGLGYLTVLRRRNIMYYPSPGFARNPGDGCWLEAGRRKMKLASVSPPDVSVEVLGLIVGRLESWGAIEVAPLPLESKPAVPATPT